MTTSAPIHDGGNRKVFAQPTRARPVAMPRANIATSAMSHWRRSLCANILNPQVSALFRRLPIAAKPRTSPPGPMAGIYPIFKPHASIDVARPILGAVTILPIRAGRIRHPAEPDARYINGDR